MQTSINFSSKYDKERETIENAKAQIYDIRECLETLWDTNIQDSIYNVIVDLILNDVETLFTRLRKLSIRLDNMEDSGEHS